MVYDGAPSQNLYACDLKGQFLDLEYDLFKDKATPKTHCIAADVFAPGSALDEVDGKIDAIYAASFFHIFSWGDQIKLCRRIIKILKAQKGSLVFRRQFGDIKGHEIADARLAGATL